MEAWASAVFYRIVADPTLPPATRDQLRESLLKYCARDTLALAQIHRWLIGESGWAVTAPKGCSYVPEKREAAKQRFEMFGRFSVLSSRCSG